MVEFCQQCRESLPKGDLTFWMGESFTSPDYRCPRCGEIANPNAPKVVSPDVEPPPPDQDLVFRKGKSNLESPPSS
jgi:hypothetical protein